MFLTDGLPDRRYDCYVIGAGPAGITLALELAKANKSVLVFETGTLTEPRGDMPNAVNYGHFPDGWWDQHSIRALGGTSRVWSGWCATLMEVDFANPVTLAFGGLSRSPIWPRTIDVPPPLWTASLPSSTSKRRSFRDSSTGRFPGVLPHASDASTGRH